MFAFAVGTFACSVFVDAAKELDSKNKPNHVSLKQYTHRNTCLLLGSIGNAKIVLWDYNRAMTRYTAMVVLLLSILMPLQVAAEALLSASPCPGEMSLAMDDTDSGEPMPCCLDEDTKNSDTCKTAKTCYICKTPGQVYLPVPSVFASLADLSLSPKPLLSHLKALNPASIWRPPSVS